jgi:hypothetical protein
MKAIIAVLLLSLCSAQVFAAPRAQSRDVVPSRDANPVDRARDVRDDARMRARAAGVDAHEGRQGAVSDLNAVAAADQLVSNSLHDQTCGADCRRQIEVMDSVERDHSKVEYNQTAINNNRKAINTALQSRSLGTDLPTALSGQGINGRNMVESCGN